jgi:hypothetical protein
MSALLDAKAPVSPLKPRLETLRISEIFYSLQGETSRAGLPTTCA